VCLFLGFVFLTTVGTSYGNNIAVSNVSLTGRDISAGANNASNFVMVKFDLSWENSWRLSGGPSNWDAAWVFVKYRLPGGVWQHAWLNNLGHTAASGSIINRGLLTPGAAFNAATNPALGVFIYRSSAGNGNVNFSNLQLRWNYGAQGISDGAAVDVQVYAIEMVYVPQSSFYLGSGGTESGSFTDGSWSSGATIPFLISSEAAVGIDNAAGKLWGTSTTGNNTIGNVAADAEATLSADFPKGFSAFYCMKYEISQGQYRDFLNTLDYTQQVQRTALVPTSSAGTGALIDPIANRQGIEIQTPGVASTTPAVYACNLDNDGNYNEAEDGEWIACNFLSWQDGCAYMDWAGLRPMTELEFEKAARGNQLPISSEYAWGSTTTTPATTINITNSGEDDEYCTGGANSVSANGTDGPLRVGSFATASTSRIQAGASYWGIMELSGNLSERPITVGNSAGRAYTGLHGNGELSSNGRANVAGWPTLNGAGEVNSATGSGIRGGNYGTATNQMPVSARTQGAATNGTRFNTAGFRGVRNAPLL